jgi:exosortase
VDLGEEWNNNPLYSFGFFVPVFAIVLLALRRDRMPSLPLQPSWWALVFLVVAGTMRLGAGYYYFSWPDRASLLFMVFAATLAIGGWAAARWAWPSIFFLGFMIPFPGFVESGLMRPLRRVATLGSTNVLQTIGIFAHDDGNVILLSEVPMGVEEACSGLGMLSTFVALTVGACFVMQRPVWQKLLIAASSIPIALVCNIVRISVTGVWHEYGDHDTAQWVHDISGYLMPVLGLVLLLAELKLLDFVFVLDETIAAALPPEPSKPHATLTERTAGATLSKTIS